MNHLQEQTSSRYSNVSTELVRIYYDEDFTTYEIFESLQTLIKWVLEVALAYEFFLVMKRSDVSEMQKNGRVLLSCDREGTYRNKNAKTQDKRGQGVQEVRNVVVYSY